MQTMAPPEEVLNERFTRIDERFVDVNRRFDEVDRKVEQVDRRITEAKEETNHRFDRVEGDIVELKKGVATVQTTLIRMSIGLALAFATIVAKGL
ncbi:MAG TPA: hypothetical protein VGV69_10410 [Solirubrobacterales bacterium]|nr:hypothetical protein [Solirubrobacterales bacterium]